MANPPDENMTAAPWEDADAAEYVLGTLDAAERRAAGARMGSDPAFAQAVRAWEGRLSPLAGIAADARPAIPPAWVWPAIEARLPGAAPSASAAPSAAPAVAPRREAEIIDLRARLRYWRGTAAVATVAAAAMLALLIVPPGVVPFDPRSAPGPVAEGPPAEAGTWVAVLQPGGDAPAYVAEVNLAAGTLSLRPLRPTPPPAGRVYEMWAVGGDRAQPVSLGLLGQGGEVPLDALGGPVAGAVLAVSVEPEGGSPTGQPTGDVVFTGELIRAD
ncbi:anti-sigma factor [Albimonas sp. CAU 1670]|uniref:anti-sigma factor n=1 Tax=Albimonas sp. CAU 1670 TaxID=3032599 RepID=UPI0023D9B102|nr:anti-sigma factor [Albimonas sp. CAU 1670]MDF2235783.1 anti-sigma factor [Albimonas sp. CAU 1670]